jgi:endonuclease-3 related protein
VSFRILDIYTLLFRHFGPQHWWPGETPFEVAVGAILTQNTSWSNVTKAIANLKGAGVLSPEGLSSLPLSDLAVLIRPAGYFNLKAARLVNFLKMIGRYYDGSFDALLGAEAEELRGRLLSVKGIGPETADSILLYAAQRPVFVVDAYTHRILFRHGLIEEEIDYHSLQERITASLPQDDVALFNEYHALLVRTGKEFCRKSKPLCPQCPLNAMAP